MCIFAGGNGRDGRDRGRFLVKIDGYETDEVILVHLTGKRRTLAFGSIAAIFHHLTPDEVGCGYDYLRRAGLSGGGTVVTKLAIIQQTTLLTAPRSVDGSAEE